MKQNISKFIACFLIVSLASSCAHQSQSVVKSKHSNASQEIELGESIHQEVLQKIPPYQEEGLNRYVTTVGTKLADQAKRKGLIYRFVILNDSRIYAMHAPGGYVYITTGFFNFLQNEIELAAVLAYEIGALQYRDPRLSKMKKFFNFLMAGGSVVAPAFGGIGVLGFLVVALTGHFFGIEKSAEKQVLDADKNALGYLTESGYDPQGFIDVLRRIQDPNSLSRPYLYDYLQSHPINEKRLAKLDKQFHSLPLENKTFQSGREVYLEATKSLKSTLR